MKIKLLFVFLAFLLLSCSSDDNATTVNNNDDNNNPVVEKQLTKIETYSIVDVNNPEDFLLTEEKTYLNGLIQEETYYSYATGDATTQILYTHDAEGKLTYIDRDGLNSDTDISFEYDDLGRLTSLYLEGSSEITDITFTYDEPNQIYRTYTVTDLSGDTTSTGMFYFLDEEGYIYKSERDADNPSATEGVYENGNIMHVLRSEYDEESEEYVTTIRQAYEYDMVTVVKGDYIHMATMTNLALAVGNNQFGTNKANESLYHFNGVPARRRANYPTYFYQNGELWQTREYDFDEDGYPVEVRYINDTDGVWQKEVITYE